MHRKDYFGSPVPKMTEEQQKLVTDNLRLAYHYAKKKPILGIDRDENESEALFCLSRAAANFDPNRGFKFSTFAYTVWLNHRKDANQQRKTPARGYMAEQMSLQSEAARIVEPADKGLRPDEIVAKKDDIDNKRQCFSVLDARAKSILEKRIEGKSLATIGKEMGITRERVRQIENSSVYRLQYLFGVSVDLKNIMINKLHEQRQKRTESNKEYQRHISGIKTILQKYPTTGAVRIAKIVGCSVRLAETILARKKQQISAEEAQ